MLSGALGFDLTVWDTESIRINRDTLRHVMSLVDSNETISQLKHVVSKTDDDELSILRSFLDVVCYNGDIFEIQSSIDFIHHVKRSGLVVM